MQTRYINNLIIVIQYQQKILTVTNLLEPATLAAPAAAGGIAGVTIT
jgi:hypothetical protein